MRQIQLSLLVVINLWSVSSKLDPKVNFQFICYQLLGFFLIFFLVLTLFCLNLSIHRSMLQNIVRMSWTEIQNTLCAPETNIAATWDAAYILRFNSINYGIIGNVSFYLLTHLHLVFQCCINLQLNSDLILNLRRIHCQNTENYPFFSVIKTSIVSDVKKKLGNVGVAKSSICKHSIKKTIFWL